MEVFHPAMGGTQPWLGWPLRQRPAAFRIDFTNILRSASWGRWKGLQGSRQIGFEGFLDL